MSWIGPTQYNRNDMCILCAQRLGTEKGVYRISPCNHLFHNDCLLRHCDGDDDEERNGEITCPYCEAEVDENTCMNVYAFNKAKNLWYSPYASASNKIKTEDQHKLLQNGYVFLESETYLYEANIPPLLRFFHIKNISPSGWIALPK